MKSTTGTGRLGASASGVGLASAVFSCGGRNSRRFFVGFLHAFLLFLLEHFLGHKWDANLSRVHPKYASILILTIMTIIMGSDMKTALDIINTVNTLTRTLVL